MQTYNIPITQKNTSSSNGHSNAAGSNLSSSLPSNNTVDNANQPSATTTIQHLRQQQQQNQQLLHSKQQQFSRVATTAQQTTSPNRNSGVEFYPRFESRPRAESLQRKHEEELERFRNNNNAASSSAAGNGAAHSRPTSSRNGSVDGGKNGVRPVSIAMDKSTQTDTGVKKSPSGGKCTVQ